MRDPVYWSAGILPAMTGLRIGDLASAEAGKMPARQALSLRLDENDTGERPVEMSAEVADRPHLAGLAASALEGGYDTVGTSNERGCQALIEEVGAMEKNPMELEQSCFDERAKRLRNDQFRRAFRQCSITYGREFLAFGSGEDLLQSRGADQQVCEAMLIHAARGFAANQECGSGRNDLQGQRQLTYEQAVAATMRNRPQDDASASVAETHEKFLSQNNGVAAQLGAPLFILDCGVVHQFKVARRFGA
jgi:hypothetical protein